MTEFARVAVASRAFSLATILGLAIALSDRPAMASAVVIMGVGGVASYVTSISSVPNHWIIAAEAGVASLVVVSALPDSKILLPYLVALPLLTGLARGLMGASLTIGCQFTAMFLAGLIYGGFNPADGQLEFLAPWALTIIGSGLIGAWAKKLGKSPAGTSVDESYDAARRLLRQLRTLARRLPSGLDPVTVTQQILKRVSDGANCYRSVVFTKSEGGVFVPLAYSGAGAEEAFDPSTPEIALCWSKAELVTAGISTPSFQRLKLLIMPVRLGKDVVAVVVGHVGGEITPQQLSRLQDDLDDLALPLETALAFSEVRSLVTTDERQRLAREIHDGVAQEVASLGYVIDELAETSSDPNVLAGLQDVRAELSRVVTELRLSIFDLRSDVGDGPTLGSALSDYVRKVGSRSALRVHLTLDEASTRLSPETESELFRIAQEAITNARKHSRAENLWVDCWVRPPNAFIRVRDDGCGLLKGRPDSYGLRIMRERAERIDAGITVEQDHETPGRPGTCVTISLGNVKVNGFRGVSAAS